MKSRLGIILFGCILAAAMTTVVPVNIAHAQTTQITLQDGSITPSRIAGKLGKSISLSVVNRGSKKHNFVIKDFYIFSQDLNPGQATSVGFTPDKVGSFPFWSDTGGKPESGMRGTITITQ